MTTEIRQNFSPPEGYSWDEWIQELEQQFEQGFGSDIETSPFALSEDDSLLLSTSLTPSANPLLINSYPSYNISNLTGDPEELNFSAFETHVEQRQEEIFDVITLVDEADFLSDSSLNYFSEKITQLEDRWSSLSEQAADTTIEPQARAQALNQAQEINQQIDSIAGFYLQAQRAKQALAEQNLSSSQEAVVQRELEFAARFLQRSLENTDPVQARQNQQTAENIVAGILNYGLIANQLSSFIGVSSSDRALLWRSYQTNRTSIRRGDLDNLRESLSENLEDITSE